ncbi:hypothetical protein DdX_16296 [Ditylenchus destructor]|uniref:Uncharacterized protein n=1 Tax=Ditylenchus destructor TaxID=166010 RepID=A0AAD4R035_9BILA|nr:hypothetical protein DdX_16296 [Ditylenchus destructor]
MNLLCAMKYYSAVILLFADQQYAPFFIDQGERKKISEEITVDWRKSPRWPPTPRSLLPSITGAFLPLNQKRFHHLPICSVLSLRNAHTEEISVPIAEVGKEIQELEPVLTGPSTNLEDPNPRPKRGANGKRTGTRLRSFTKGLMKKDFKNLPSFLLATFKLNWTCYRAFILRAFKRKRFDETKLKKEVSGFCRWLVRWGQNGSTKLRTFGGFVATIFMSAISIKTANQQDLPFPIQPVPFLNFTLFPPGDVTPQINPTQFHVPSLPNLYPSTAELTSSCKTKFMSNGTDMGSGYFGYPIRNADCEYVERLKGIYNSASYFPPNETCSEDVEGVRLMYVRDTDLFYPIEVLIKCESQINFSQVITAKRNFLKQFPILGNGASTNGENTLAEHQCQNRDGTMVKPLYTTNLCELEQVLFHSAVEQKIIITDFHDQPVDRLRESYEKLNKKVNNWLQYYESKTNNTGCDHESIRDKNADLCLSQFTLKKSRTGINMLYQACHTTVTITRNASITDKSEGISGELVLDHNKLLDRDLKAKLRNLTNTARTACIHVVSKAINAIENKAKVVCIERVEEALSEELDQFLNECYFLHAEEEAKDYCYFYYDPEQNTRLNIIEGTNFIFMDPSLHKLKIRELVKQNRTDTCVSTGGCDMVGDTPGSCDKCSAWLPPNWGVNVCSAKQHSPHVFAPATQRICMVPYCSVGEFNAGKVNVGEALTPKSSRNRFFCFQKMIDTKVDAKGKDKSNTSLDVITGFFNPTVHRNFIKNEKSCLDSREFGSIFSRPSSFYGNSSQCANIENKYFYCCQAELYPVKRNSESHPTLGKMCNSGAGVVDCYERAQPKKLSDPGKLSSTLIVSFSKSIYLYDRYNPLTGIFSVLCDQRKWTATEEIVGYACRLVSMPMTSLKKYANAELSCCCAAKLAKSYKEIILKNREKFILGQNSVL